MLNGEVKVMLTKVNQGVFARAYLEDHQSRAELGPMPTWVIRMVTGRVLGSGWDRERVYVPLIEVTADVESGELGWCWPHNTAPQYEALATWLRPRVS